MITGRSGKHRGRAEAAGVLAVLQATALLAAELPGVGKLLVATRKSSDAELSKTVVLLIDHNAEGAIGLILNRRIDAPLSRVFSEMKGKPGGSTQLYFAGPIDIGVRALVRSRTWPNDAALKLYGDVYVVANNAAIRKRAAATPAPGEFRVYAGYTGWSATQLRNEVSAGLWYVAPGAADIVFDAHPESLWRRLLERVQIR
jgi:putative transcriptional regulator